MYDQSEYIGKTLIQHGKYNDRIYLIQMDDSDENIIIGELDKLASKNKYSKIFAKIKNKHKDLFLENGFEVEATAPLFFSGEEDCLFVCKYPIPERKELNEEIKAIIDENLAIAVLKAGTAKDYILPEGFTMRKLGKEDVSQLAALYKIVFATYPFPIHEESFLLDTMESHVDYYGIFKGDKLVAASSAEKYESYLNAEMTDFATNPKFLGHGFAVGLLQMMEQEMNNSGYKMLYTIARSMSPGMNITFSKLNYKFGGTLINNTNISGNIECMNIWYKSI